jgi:hypothetical protein
VTIPHELILISSPSDLLVGRHDAEGTARRLLFHRIGSKILRLSFLAAETAMSISYSRKISKQPVSFLIA